MADIDDDDFKPERVLMIFGRDVSKIPCFRESFLYGISSGIGIGLAAFMTTSKPRLASHVAVSSFVLITVSFWSYCRYNWSTQRFLAAQIQEGLRRNALYDGTELHKHIKEHSSETTDV